MTPFTEDERNLIESYRRLHVGGSLPLDDRELLKQIRDEVGDEGGYDCLYPVVLIPPGKSRSGGFSKVALPQAWIDEYWGKQPLEKQQERKTQIQDLETIRKYEDTIKESNKNFEDLGKIKQKISSLPEYVELMELRAILAEDLLKTRKRLELDGNAYRAARARERALEEESKEVANDDA